MNKTKIRGKITGFVNQIPTIKDTKRVYHLFSKTSAKFLTKEEVQNLRGLPLPFEGMDNYVIINVPQKADYLSETYQDYLENVFELIEGY